MVHRIGYSWAGKGWYIARYASRNRLERSEGYLHTDGVWRESAYNHETGKYSGFFKTRQAARDALKIAKAQYAEQAVA